MFAAFGVLCLPARVPFCNRHATISSIGQPGQSTSKAKSVSSTRPLRRARAQPPVVVETAAASARALRVAELKAARAEHMKALWQDPSFRERWAQAQSRGGISETERAKRSERLRARWRDPAWRESMLQTRGSPEAARKLSEMAKLRWMDPVYREKMRLARLGRPAPNKGVSPSDITRLRMSVARKGVKKSEETRRKMSEAKRNRPEGDNWPQLISESKRGKGKEYFQMRREFRALHKDLKLWSDSYCAKYGKLPDASTYEMFVAPMMVFRIRRYLTLRQSFGHEEEKLMASSIISDN